MLGTETDWLGGGTYQPASHAQMAYWRTLSGAKPYLLLMNTDFDALAPYVERYFQRCLFYGFYPSMFSHNASDNPYWQTPAWYNRDRPLFRKYLPVIRRVAEAGWQPVTGAACDNPAIWVERFGPDADGIRYYTLCTDSTKVQAGVLREDEAAAGSNTSFVTTELLSGAVVPRAGDGWAVQVPPQAAAVVRLEPGPRFRAAALVPGDKVRFTIDTPLGVTQVLEFSLDLHSWQPLATDTPTESPYVIELPRTGTVSQFYRLRF